MKLQLLAALALALPACGAEQETPLCEPKLIESSMRIRVLGFAASYGDLERAELSFCLSGASCGAASITGLQGELVNGVECRADASLGAPRQFCVLEPDGTLLVMIELNGSPSKLQGHRVMTLELSSAGFQTVTGEASVFLEPKEEYGEGCGVSHVFGSVTVDATLREPVTG